MEALLWTCVLGLLSTPAGAAGAEPPVVFQTPNAISLMKVNSTAEIQCRTTLIDPTGLYLKRRFSKEMEVLYFSVQAVKSNINREYKDRLHVTGQCCDYKLQLSQLGVKDTDGYYCAWSKLNVTTGSLTTYESKDTIIIVRERDPKEGCHRTVTQRQILSLLSMIVCVIVVCVFLGVLAWWWRTRNQGDSYRPTSAHQRHHRFCTQHNDQQYIYNQCNQ